MPEGPCFNQLFSKIVLKNITPRRCDSRVRKACREYYELLPGYEFREVPILLNKPMLVGIDEEEGRILMPFRKPCYGTSLYIIEAGPEEIARLRADLCNREIPAPVKKAGVRKKKQKKPVE
jgi:hypothetical protein